MSKALEGRILALDVGGKRIGVAVSDPLGITAQAMPTFFRSGSLPDDLARLNLLAIELDVRMIVLGLPRNMNGSEGKQAESVRVFATALNEVSGIDFCLVDERLTTAAADSLMRTDGQNRKKRSQSADRIAAQLILQSYLGN